MARYHAGYTAWLVAHVRNSGTQYKRCLSRVSASPAEPVTSAARRAWNARHRELHGEGAVRVGYV